MNINIVGEKGRSRRMSEKKQVWMDMDGCLFIRFWTERYGYVLEDEHGLWPDHELMWCGYWHCLGEL